MGPLGVAPAMAAALTAVPALLVWCTDWQEMANDTFAQFFGHTLPFLPRPWGTETRWWKLDAIHRHLDEHPHLTRVIWADDHLNKRDTDEGLRRKQIATRELKKRGVGSFLIVPESTIGLKKRDLSAALAWLNDPTPKSNECQHDSRSSAGGALNEP
jgi:hypothetical protein